MSLWDHNGFGESITADGCYVVRYENGKIVEAWGPYSSEQKSSNARRRIGRGLPNRADNTAHLEELPYGFDRL